MSFLYKGHYLLDIKTITPTLHKDTPTKPRPDADSAVKQTSSSKGRVRHGQKPPELPMPPHPASPAVSVSPPPVQPKSARAIARKFEMEFANKKTNTPSSRQPNSSSQQHSNNTAASARTTSKSDKSSTGGSKATPTPGPPVPTSIRPAINRTLSYQLGQTSSPVLDTKTNRSYTTIEKPVALAKPVPVSSLSVAAGSTPSSSSSSTASQHPLVGKAGSTVLLSSQSKYQNLLRERAQTSGSVRVTSGPNFSFYVS